MHQFRFTYSVLITLLLAISFSSCEQTRVFDKNVSLDKKGWYYGEAKSFDVEILDTTMAYNLYINVRHTDEYPYNNLWLKLTTTMPDGSVQENKLNA